MKLQLLYGNFPSIKGKVWQHLCACSPHPHLWDQLFSCRSHDARMSSLSSHDLAASVMRRASYPTLDSKVGWRRVDLGPITATHPRMPARPPMLVCG